MGHPERCADVGRRTMAEFEGGQRWAELHVRIVEGEGAACDALAQAALPYLMRRLARWSPRADRDMLTESVDRAVCAYLSAPRQYDSTRGVSLAFYLVLRARSCLSALWRQQERRRRHEVSGHLEGV